MGIHASTLEQVQVALQKVLPNVTDMYVVTVLFFWKKNKIYLQPMWPIRQDYMYRAVRCPH